MKKFTFQDVHDCQVIQEHGDMVIFLGKHPWIFRKDGTFIARLKGICRSWNMLLLPDNRVFFDGYGDRSYHYVSLTDGEMLWSIPKKGKRNFIPHEMAASPSKKEVYYVYSIGEKFYIDIIVPEEKTCTKKLLPIEDGPIYCVFCSSEGSVATLREDHSADRVVGVSGYSLDVFNISDVQQHHQLWQGQIKLDAFPVRANDTYILFSDLSVLNMKDGTIFSLLENCPQRIRKDVFTFSGYDPVRQLLNIHYLGSKSTLIIDCQKRKIAAHYRPISDGQNGGWLIDEEFWIGSLEGIVKRPFPHIDPYPRRFFEDP